MIAFKYMNRNVRRIRVALSALLLLTVALSAFSRTTAHPDFKAIKAETLNPESRYYYPRLLSSFLNPADTTLTDDEYHYLYYGTMFQDDYNPYRPNPYSSELSSTEPLYVKASETLTRSEKEQIRKTADLILSDNPFNLRQLSYKVYALDKLQKNNLAKIWRHKLTRLISVILNSGTGTDKDHAIVIVYPSNEIELFNIFGGVVQGMEFEEPYYEKVTVVFPQRTDRENKTGVLSEDAIDTQDNSTVLSTKTTDPKVYWFDLHHVLEQYYEKHPSEKY